MTIQQFMQRFVELMHPPSNNRTQRTSSMNNNNNNHGRGYTTVYVHPPAPFQGRQPLQLRKVLVQAFTRSSSTRTASSSSSSSSPKVVGSIREALQVVRPGGVVYLHEGVYPEKVTVDRDVVIEGLGRREAIVLCGGKSTSLLVRGKTSRVRCQVRNVTLHNTQPRNGYGVLIAGTTAHATLSQCTVLAVDVGVLVYKGGRAHITGCEIHGGARAAVYIHDKGGGSFAAVVACDIHRAGDHSLPFPRRQIPECHHHHHHQHRPPSTINTITTNTTNTTVSTSTSTSTSTPAPRHQDTAGVGVCVRGRARISNNRIHHCVRGVKVMRSGVALVEHNSTFRNQRDIVFKRGTHNIKTRYNSVSSLRRDTARLFNAAMMS